MSSLLPEIVALARPETRADAAAAIGRRAGGDTLLVFIRDPEVGLLLPAPGFPQTLPNGRAWRSFVERCAAAGEGVTDAVSLPGDAALRPAFGVAQGQDAVAVVVGIDRDGGALAELRALLPLLGAIFDGERATATARSAARIAIQSAAHAEAMAQAFDLTRAQLQRALVEADGVRRTLQEVNRQLTAQAHELEAANLQLQDQAMELEAQAAEQELQADELQDANLSLEAARVAAEAANRAKSDFLATMSHELRTPLNAIGGHVQLVQLGIYGPVTEAQRDALQRVDRSQRHLLGLINDILNLARIEAGRVEYRIRNVCVADVVDDLQPMIGPQLAMKRLRYDVTVDRALEVRADAEKLQQVLLNLLSNAVKFTPAGGAITLASDAGDGKASTALVRVTDTGIGIVPDRIHDIFEPFVQVDARHSRTEEGTGLGLSISRDLARGMGGDLTVVSRPGEGSTFTLSLPRA